jgi:hypothetical protein
MLCMNVTVIEQMTAAVMQTSKRRLPLVYSVKQMMQAARTVPLQAVEPTALC